SQYEHTLQLGDFGFNYDCLTQVDYNKHKLFAGNHDNPDLLNEVPHNLGKFGLRTINGKSFFFISGGYSIDYRWRTPMVDWFPNEELSQEEMTNCIKSYKNVKPSLVISHECPCSIVGEFSPHTNDDLMRDFECKLPSSTGRFLDTLLEIHQPEMWIFGHYHQHTSFMVKNTQFYGLRELEVVTVI